MRNLPTLLIILPALAMSGCGLNGLSRSEVDQRLPYAKDVDSGSITVGAQRFDYVRKLDTFPEYTARFQHNPGHWDQVSVLYTFVLSDGKVSDYTWEESKVSLPSYGPAFGR